jgi:hypothetical protein
MRFHRDNVISSSQLQLSCSRGVILGVISAKCGRGLRSSRAPNLRYSGDVCGVRSGDLRFLGALEKKGKSSLGIFHAITNTKVHRPFAPVTELVF